MVNGVYTESRECPYAQLSLRSDVRDMMNRLESLFPGTRQSTLQGFEKIAQKAGGNWAQMELGTCHGLRRTMRRGDVQGLRAAGKVEDYQLEEH